MSGINLVARWPTQMELPKPELLSLLVEAWELPEVSEPLELLLVEESEPLLWFDAYTVTAEIDVTNQL